MSCKRNDFECIDEGNNGLGPMTKKVKSPLPSVEKLNLQNGYNDHTLLDEKQSRYGKTLNTIESNDSMKLSMLSNLSPQSSSGVPHSRKRRSRIPQETNESTQSSDSSIPIATTSANNQARKKSDLSCVVCCGLAHGYNFDAISCESCKAFFRRNALFNTDRLKCRRDGTCEITLDTRRRCKSCRLKKCFAVGMRKEWILTEEEKINKKRRIEENRRLRVTSLNQSLDANDDKSNFDLQSVVLDQDKDTSLNTRKSSIQNNDVVQNVLTAFNNGFQLEPISYGWSYPIAKKITAICQILNTKNTTALRLISFYKRLPEFDALNEIDKVNLIKHNLPYIFIFHGSLGYDPVNDIYHEGLQTNDALLYGADIREVHGDDIHLRCTSIMRSLQSFVQLDKRIMQLSLIIMLFSKGLSSMMNTNETLLHDYQQVFQVQNFYVEHLWTFMEKSFGTKETIRTFSTLVSQCLLIQALLRDIQQDLHEKIDPFQVPPIIRTIMHLS